MVKQLKFKITYPSLSINDEGLQTVDENKMNTKYFRDTDEVMQFLDIKSINVFSKIIKGKYKYKCVNSAYLKHVKIERLDVFYPQKPVINKQTLHDTLALNHLQKLMV